MHRAVARFVLTVVAVAALGVPAAAEPAPRRLSFAEIASAVLQNNLQLRVAAFEVSIARAQLAQAQGGRQPQVSVAGAYTRTQEQAGQTFSFPNPFSPTPPTISVSLPAPDANVYAARLGIRYPLYTGGRIEAQIALAQANLAGAQAVFERTKQQTLFAAQQVYRQGLLAGENVAAAARAIDQARESLRVARARVTAGAAPQFDALQAEVAVANAEQMMVRAQTAVESAQADLNAALNLPLDTRLEFADTLEPRPVCGGLADAIARALRDRPDLSEIRNRIRAAQAGIDLAVSGARPTVSLGAGYEVGNAGGQAGSVSGSWIATLSVTLSLFDGGITRERIREAQLRVEQLRVMGAQTGQRVELEVRQAWLALEQAAGEMAAAGKAVEQGREAARIAVVRYEAGVGTSLEVLSAQASLAQAELSLASARFNQSLARIQLMLATGAL